MRVCIDNLENADNIYDGISTYKKNFADFINMTISEEKLYIQAMDTSKISVFEVKLMPSFFQHLNYQKPKRLVLMYRYFVKY